MSGIQTTTGHLFPPVYAQRNSQKFDPAVVCDSLAQLTLLTTTLPPLALVTRTSTVSVPNPLVFSKKL